MCDYGMSFKNNFFFNIYELQTTIHSIYTTIELPAICSNFTYKSGIVNYRS